MSATVDSFPLPNGMVVITAARGALPLATARYVALDTGIAYADGVDADLPELTARSLVSGGTRFGNDEMRDVAIGGMHVEPIVDTVSTSLQLRVGSAGIGGAIRILGRTVREPTFSELGPSEAALEHRLLAGWNRVGTMSHRLLQEMLFGPQDRRALQPRKELEQLRGFHAADVRRWYARYRPARSLLIVVGQFDPEQVRRDVNLAFGDWSIAQPAPATKLPESLDASTGTYVLQNGNDLTQITFAYRTVPLYHPDHLALDLLANALNRTMTSGAWVELRQRTGNAYYVSAAHIGTPADGQLVVSTYVRPDAVPSTLRLLGDAVAALGSKRLTEYDLVLAKRERAEALELRAETNAMVAAQLDVVPTQGDRAEALPKLRAQLTAFTLEQLRVLARRYLNDKRRVVLITGPYGRGDPRLRALRKPTFYGLE